MAKTSLTKEQAVSIAQRARRERARDRQAVRNIEVACVHKASVLVGAAVIGGLTRAGVSNQIGPVPWKVPAFLVLTALEAFVPNRVLASIFGGLSDAAAATYTDRAVCNKAAGWHALAIAGEGDGSEI